MRTNTNWAAGGLLAMLAAATVLVGCSGGIQGFDSNDCDFLMNAGSLDGGTFPPRTTDRDCPTDYVWPMEITVTLRFSNENPGFPDPEGNFDPTVATNFQLDEYLVEYRNESTGGTRPGVDVPAPFLRGLGVVSDMPFQNADDTFTFEIDGLTPILLAEQKTAAPLNNDAFFSSGPIQLRATITWFGHGVGNQRATCFDDFPISFTVFRSPEPTDPFNCF